MIRLHWPRALALLAMTAPLGLLLATSRCSEDDCGGASCTVGSCEAGARACTDDQTALLICGEGGDSIRVRTCVLPAQCGPVGDSFDCVTPAGEGGSGSADASGDVGAEAAPGAAPDAASENTADGGLGTIDGAQAMADGGRGMIDGTENDAEALGNGSDADEGGVDAEHGVDDASIE